MRNVRAVLIGVLFISFSIPLSRQEASADSDWRRNARVDLLRLVLGAHHHWYGRWETEGGVLTSLPAGDGRSRIEFPYLPGGEYDLRLRVEPRKGPRAVAIGLVMGGHPFMAVIDGGGSGDQTGLTLDGKEPALNGTLRRGVFLAHGRTSRIACFVRKDSVRVEVDGKGVINWRGRPGRLTMPASWQVSNSRYPFVGSVGGAVAIRSVSIVAPDGRDMSVEAKRINSIRAQYEAQLRRERNVKVVGAPDDE